MEIGNLLLRLWQHLSRHRQRQFVFVVVLMLISAFAEVISLGALIPFLTALVAPEKILNHPLLASLGKHFGFTAPSEILLPLTVIFVIAAIFAGAIRILLLWASNRLAFATGADLGLDVYRRTLYQPYLAHIGRNSSEISSGVTYKVNTAVDVLRQMLTLISSLILLIAIMTALLMVNTTVAFAVATCFGALYGLISWVLQKRLAANSERIAKDTTQVLKVVQEGLGGIRDVLLDGTQQYYCDIYRRAEYRLRLAIADNYFMGGSPRFVMEALGMTLIATLAYQLIQKSNDSAETVMILGTLALGAQRILPALQQIYFGWTGIVGSKNSLIDALAYLDQPLPEDAFFHPPRPMIFERCIELRELGFRYHDSTPVVLDGINIKIAKGERIGLVGSTGSGKSTLLDLLMSLMKPTHGEILVDGNPITNCRAWQRNIAHVPQSIYLSDATIAENIAFGIPIESIDMERVRIAAIQARIADFIESNPNRYEALVGERGIRLSGGQRQRIGIARALYKQATVLVFDEATSALDNATELEVMEAIDGLDRNLTVLIVAHRLTTVKHCDNIIVLENGKVVEQGSFDNLLLHSASFRKLATIME